MSFAMGGHEGMLLGTETDEGVRGVGVHEGWDEEEGGNCEVDVPGHS
jgi:hypothetical protein